MEVQFLKAQDLINEYVFIKIWNSLFFLFLNLVWWGHKNKNKNKNMNMIFYKDFFYLFS